MRRPSRAPVVLVLALLSCAGPDDTVPRIEQVEGVAYWRAASEQGPFTAHGLTAALESSKIVCRRKHDGAPIHYLTFERAGDKQAYGAYGLAGAKNGMPIDRPLSGEPINWPNRDEQQALVHLLTLVGLEEAAAARLLTARSEHLFDEGLRVLFVLAIEGQPTVLSVELGD